MPVQHRLNRDRCTLNRRTVTWQAVFLCFILCHSMKIQSCFQKAEQTSKLPLEFALTLNSLHKEFKLQKIRTGRGCERSDSMKIHDDLQQRQRSLEEQQ